MMCVVVGGPVVAAMGYRDWRATGELVKAYPRRPDSYRQIAARVGAFAVVLTPGAPRPASGVTVACPSEVCQTAGGGRY